MRRIYFSILDKSLNLCNQLYPIDKKAVEQFLRQVAFIADQFAFYVLHERGVIEWFPIIDIGWSEYKVKKLASLITDNVKFEPEKPG